MLGGQVGNPTWSRRRSSRVVRPSRSEWWVVSDRLLACIRQKRREDGHRAWSFEAIGAAVGCSGAAIGKICRGHTRQPAVEIVDRLAALLGVDRTVFTEGQLPVTAASESHRDHLCTVLGWLDESLLAGLERVTDPAIHAMLNDGIQAYIVAAHDQSRARTHTSPPLSSNDRIMAIRAASAASPPPQKQWRIDPDRLNGAIHRFASRNPPHTWSNAVIGDSIGLSETSVIRIRQGHVKQPDLVALHRLASFLHTSLEDITSGDVPQIPPGDSQGEAAVTWLSDENRAGLAIMTDPTRREIVTRGIRLLLEHVTLNQMAARRTDHDGPKH